MPVRRCATRNQRAAQERAVLASAQERRRQGPTVRSDPYYEQYQGAPEYPPYARTEYGQPPGGPPPGKPSGSGGEWRNRALIAAAFVLGVGAGVWFTEDVNLYPNNVASTELIDRKTPNSELCMSNGYSSMVFDQRLFVTFNPFNVYVTQPEIKPGCVLRRSNYNVLETRKLVSRDEADMCKRGMNTFAFVGDLENAPEVSCVYHSEQAENQYLVNPRLARMGDGRRPLDAPPTEVP